ncbi:MAG TPA: ATP-binding cassette domain-containing protein [Armatimonadota bacterium]|nr:ATP-binding cassette domain-containing protein [Armatimonadota bacterium]
MSETFVECRNLGRTYQRRTTAIVALAGVTVTVQAGDRIAVVGPSGGGKSTLLQLMGALDLPTEGDITWPALGPRESLRPRHIGYVFQTQSLLPPLTVVENVELPLILVGEHADLARDRALDVLRELDLVGIAEKLPEELSGGQAQRVAVARAFVGHPQLILADEPTGQLDHPTAQHLFDVLLASLAGRETALVVATHDLLIAERLPVQWHLAHGHLEVV